MKGMYIKRLVAFGIVIFFIIFILIVNIPHKVVKAYDNLYYGIDVSSNQGTINWSNAKNAGISFAIIRSGLGKYTFQEDKKFKSNYTSAKSIGIKCGTYWISYAMSVSEAYEEAEVCYSVIKGCNFEYPVYYDMEVSSQFQNLSKQQITQIALAFCQRMASHGYTVGVYANLNWFTNYIDKNQIVNNGYEIWMAQYPVKGGTVDPTKYDKSSMCGMWQYSENGHVNGISGDVDLDVSYKNYVKTSYMNISGETKPTGTLTPGKSYPVEGKISASSNINHVWGGVYNRDGSKTAQYCEQYPNTSTYDLATYFDAHIIFNALPVGYYTYKIEATTTDGQYKCIQSDFQIGDPPDPTVEPSKSVLAANTYAITTGGSITFTATSDTATGYVIGIDKDGVRKITEEMPNGELTKLFTETGTYSAYVTSYNSAGGLDSTRITFTVSDPTITITLNPNGGKCSKSSIIVNKGGTYSGLVDATDKTGYIFAGWFTQDGKQVHNGDKLASDTAHTLSAHWTAKSVSVNFYRNQNKDDTGTVTESFTYDVKNQKFGYKTDGTGRYSPMNDANVGFGAWTKTGYELLGWSADRNANTTTYSTYSDVSNEWINWINSYSPSINLYAIWKAKQYKVTLNTNGGTVNFDSIVVTYDSTYNLPNAEKTGYHFNGWFTSSDGGTQVSSNDKVSITGEQTLYAHWSKDTMMITFDAKGGISEGETKTVKYENKYGVLPNAERTGYTFEGWYLDENCTNQITADSIVKITANQSVYAKWTLKKYTIEFDANGGAVQTASKQVTYGKNYGVLPVAVKENDTFIGWFTEGGTEITSDSIVELVDDTVVYAKWQSESTVAGDINLDGKADTQDIIFLQAYLHGREQFTIDNFYAADVLEDGQVNIFDLVILKQMLLERNGG